MISSLAKIGLCFILGITIHNYTVLLATISSVAILFLLVNINYSSRNFTSLLLLLLSLFSGFSLNGLQNLKTPRYGDNFRIATTNLHVKNVSKTKKVLTLKGVVHINNKETFNTQVICFNNTKSIKTGDIVQLINPRFSKITKSKFAYKVDFNSFLIQNNIHYKCIIDSSQLNPINSDHSIQTHLSEFKNYLIKKTKGGLEKNYDILAAVCLGDKKDLDKLSKKTFVSNGIAHIMAVSGLHIGIIYLIFFQFLRIFFRRNSKILIVIIIISLWFFVVLTGNPISAIRATLMISIYSCFKLLDRKHEKLHILVFTALIILIWNPAEIYGVGFQLSFLALIGILYFSESILSLYQPNNLIANYIWEIIAITIAVQFTTLPIIIYYFHSFPLHFILTNIIAIPFAFIILLFFISYLITIFWEVISSFLLKCMDLIIDFTFSLLQWFEQYDFLYLNGLYISFQTVFAYYMALFFVFQFRKNSNYLSKAFIVLTIPFMVQTIAWKTEKNKQELYVFRDKGIGLLYKEGLHSYLFIENSKHQTNYYHPIIQNNLTKHQLKDNSLIQIGESRYLFNPLSDSLFKMEYDAIFCSNLMSCEISIKESKRKIYVTSKIFRKVNTGKVIEINDYIEL